MDHSSNTHTTSSAQTNSSSQNTSSTRHHASHREQRLRKAKRIVTLLQGVKCVGISFLLSTCVFPLGAYPLGISLVCAATNQTLFVVAGVLLSGLLPSAPLPFWGTALLCTLLVGFRLFFLWVGDRTHGTVKPPRRPSPSAHAWMTSLQDILWGKQEQDTLTDYYCGKKNTPATRETYENPPPVCPVEEPISQHIAPIFGESMVYRLLVSSLGGFGLGLCFMVMGDFAIYDLLSTLFMILLCPLFTYLLSPSFTEEGQELLSMGAPHDALPRTGHTYLLHHFSGITLVSGLILVFLCTWTARPFQITLIDPYISLCLAPILAMLLTLRTTAQRGLIPGVAVAIVAGLGADPMVSPAFILGAIAYGLLRFISHGVAVVCGSLAGLLWVLLGSGTELLVAYLPSMILVAPLCFVWDKLSAKLPPPSSASEMAMSDFSASIEQKTRAEAHIDRLEALSGAFSSLSKMFYDLSGQLRYPKLPELRRMCDEVFDRHCDRCVHRDTCDHGEHTHPADILSPAISLQLFQRGKIDMGSLPQDSLSRCIRVRDVVSDVSHRFARMSEQLLRSEKTEVFATDYEAIADLIQDTLEEDETEFSCDREAADKICDFLTMRGAVVYGVVVCGKRSCKVMVRGHKFDTSPDSIQTMRAKIEDICDVRLDLPSFEAEDGHTLMTLTSVASIKTTFAGSTVPAGTPENAPLPSPLTNEFDCGQPYVPPATCGDHIAMFQSDNACFYSLISDGMGSGEDASMTSDICTLFLEKMLSAGNRVELSIRMLNSFIRQKNNGTGDECSATVDLMELDLMSGQAVFAKNGAAPTYVVRGGNVYKLKSRTLPIGILKDSDPQFLRFRMHPGDVVVMVSDGVTQGNDECPWLIDLLSAPLPDSMDALRLEILRSAIASGSPDDLSAIAIRVEEEL